MSVEGEGGRRALTLVGLRNYGNRKKQTKIDLFFHLYVWTIFHKWLTGNTKAEQILFFDKS